MKNFSLEEISKKSIKRMGIELYNFEDAVIIVKTCQKNNIPILGIDSFILHDNKIKPSMTNSIDLSYETNCHKLALDFLQQRKQSNFIYEIVY